MSLEDNLELQTDHLSVPARGVRRPAGRARVGRPEGRPGAGDAAGAGTPWWRANSAGGGHLRGLVQLLPGRRAGLRGSLVRGGGARGPGGRQGGPRPAREPGREARRRPHVGARPSAPLEPVGRRSTGVEELLGDDMEAWRWGDLHEARFEHIVSGVVDEETATRLERGTPAARRQHLHRRQRGLRQRRDHRGRGRRVLPGRERLLLADGARRRRVGQLGRDELSGAVRATPSSPHYDDLFPMWATDEAFPLLYSREKVEAATETRIELRPTESDRPDDA